ncbi:unnamed protein product [Prorocentrum cordatum]|uniref:Enoyl reductase (ER) domain-containing protein n=1 Tax=Prorocentrum cordatum TaxID=2364126 RepID=A0ABN9SVL0_9DINO|nr:unnamed protein product [Polarella glacialis]
MMKAWAVTKYGDASALLTAMDVEKPQPGAGEVLVKNMAIATNPIDYKVIAGALAPGEEAPPQRLIVGWDSAGVVEAVGEGVTDFQAGDKVWFAGDITKDGCYSQYTKIDSRLISKMPSTLSFEDAAALPLTFQTAWEGMVELMGVQKGKSIFVLNGAGGLGSIVIQVAKHLGLTVIASASRAETIEFCKQMGADHVVNHRNEDLGAELKQVGFDCVDYIYNAHENDRLGELFKLLVCDGRLVVTYGPTQEQMAKVDWTTVWLKRQTLCFQMMFARPMFNTEPAMVGGVMATMAKLVDQGSIKTTVTKKYGGMEHINDATKLQMSGKSIGKICLTMTH